ncbi:polyphosphate kinase 1 [Paucibacter sp. O1-1]|uniref:polyphosphate kinase 1 n=1 Tax=unclassified Roseateles TaxID=2626991 RepID=UPI0010F848C0|nr:MULTISPECIES: polyphosphate kinase 1 [unclassified Roseateles]MCU7371636.1 polyphosphate kinase 1 [Paucibacter sp. O1-1]MCZ7883428.1 polyphosphate kinase 1 [Paucibacter sp. M5-1]MDA3826625.1 polyphosphate kinase 1 [Paucibacter sp. O1-1]MDC6168177.1 polyphosphate kinase 1 [Paucibacter sp. XJ19-41]
MTLPATPSLALLNREQAILEFNRRVLAQAQRDDVPLLERLRYICIVSSNLDEFFEVRFADMLEAARDPASQVSSRDVERVGRAAHVLIDQQYAIFNEQVMPVLLKEHICILNHADRNEEQRRWVGKFFEREVRPLLMPVGLDPAHPFPQVANKSLHFIARLSGKDAFGRDNRIAIVKVPRVLPRVIKLPEAISGGQQAFVLLTSVIRAHLEELFPGRQVEAFSQFRVTRDSDLEVDEEEIANLRHALRSGLTTRHFGRAVRLEVVNTCPEELSQFLLEQFVLPPAALYRVNGPVNLVRLNELIDQTDAPALRFAPHEPVWPEGRLPRGKSIIDRIKKADVLLHHPFESFEPVLEFLREAVHDPDVLAIKQTVYRTGSKSELMDLLIEAARRGKEVMVVVELKARFDEEANINWAERLEAVGAQVVYGIVGYKTHAKLLMVMRREMHGGKPVLRRYAHLSTGNYNPKTARLYTDLGYLTADPDITADADTVFRQLASLGKIKAPKRLLLAPFNMHSRMMEFLQQVTEAARAGYAARVVLKINALTDAELIGGLLAAGQAGARVDLIVRGACMLPPGLPGVSENILVRSVVGRFLEHSRVSYFRWGDGEEQEALYLSSADWMSRNMFRRIEVAWPVLDPKLRQRVIDEALQPYLHDSLDAWQLGPDGHSNRISDSGVSAQQVLMRHFGPD